MRVLSARMAAKAPTPVSLIGASAPPVNMTAASPRRMISKASPMALEPAAQAVQVALQGPLVPSSSETCAEPMLAMIIGIKRGLSRSGPLVTRMLICSWKVCRPPTPLATRAPMSVASACTSMPASASAMRAAATANCAKRSMRRPARFSMKSVNSKPFTSPAKRTARRDGSKLAMVPMPLSPAVTRRQASSTVLPTGLTMPRPVTTTRRGMMGAGV